MNPHVCPKCKGEGTADGSPARYSGTNIPLKCWPCNGTGIVWEPADHIFIPAGVPINPSDSIPGEIIPYNPPTWPYRPYPVTPHKFYFSPCNRCTTQSCLGHEDY